MKMSRWLLVISVAFFVAGAIPAEGARSLDPPVPGAPYTRTGIPLSSVERLPTLNHLNLALPVLDLDAAAREMRTTVVQTAAVVPAAAPEEIALLAKALDDDPELIFDYVHNNYDFISSWGLLRGPVELVQAKAGNPFDQAFLLASLLNAAGYETRFVFGTIRMPVKQGLNWTGIVDEGALWSAFASGGIPSQVANGNLRLNQVWLKVKVGEAWHPLDPSFKSYGATPAMPLASALGYNKDEYLAAALSGSTVTANYAQKINESQLQAKLQGYALNLLNAIRAVDPAIPLNAVVGSRAIIPQATSVLPAELPYTIESIAGETTGIPDNWVFKLRVQAPGLDQVIPYVNIANQRLTYFYVPATNADQQKIAQAGGIYNVYPAYGVNMMPELRMGGTLLATGSPLMLGWYQQVTFTLQTAWKDAGGNRIDIGFSRNFFSSNWYTLALRNGDMSDAALARCTDGLGEQIMSGAAANSEPLLGQSLHCLGMAMHGEYGHLRRLAGQLAGIIDALNIGAMVVGQTSLVEYEASGQQRPLRVKMGSYYVDAQLNLGGVVSVNADANRERGYQSQVAWAYSATEGAILAQLQGNPGVSTVRVMDVANRQGQKLYHLTKNNVATILATLQYPSYIENSLNADVQNGYEVIVPEKNVTVNQWTGTGWYSYDPESGSMGTWLNGSVGGAAPESPDREAISGGSGGYKGVVDVGGLKKNLLACSPPPGQGPGDNHSKGLEPVDVVTGAFLYDRTDIRYAGRGPVVWFGRSYNSAARTNDGPLGYGWTHTLAQRLTPGSYWTVGGATSWAAPAAAAIAAAYVTRDSSETAPGALPFQLLIVGSETVDWESGQLNGNAATATGRDGGLTRFARLPDGVFWPVSGHPATLALLPDGSWRMRVKGGASLAFDAAGRLLGEADRSGNTVAYSYDAGGRLTRLTDAAGRKLELSYAGPRLIRIADPAGKTWQFDYDAAGNLVKATDAENRATRFEYDLDHRLLRVFDPDGGKLLENTYDALGRVAFQANGTGGTGALRYGDGRVVVTDPLGRETVHAYDAQGRVVAVGDQLGRISHWAYDPRGRVVSYTDGRGAVERYTYDGRGNLAVLTGPQGDAERYTYDTEDRLTSLTDPLGHSASLAYDSGGNLVRITDPLGRSVSFTWDAIGQLAAFTDAAGRTTSYAYTAAGDLHSLSDPQGHLTTWTYDSLGRVLSKTDATGKTSRAEWSATGNLLRAIDALNSATTYTYTGSDQVATITGALGRVTRFAYNGNQNLTTVTDAAGQVTAYSYDAAGRLARRTDPLGGAWNYTYDAAGQLVTVADPLNRTTQAVYDAAGNTTRVIQPLGWILTYAYDLKGRLTGFTYADGSSVSYTYDAADRLTKVSEAAWQGQYTYNAAGRLTGVASQDPDYALVYTYEADGRRKELVMNAAGQTVLQQRYAWDAAGRLQSVTDVLHNRVAGATYDAAGRLLTESGPDDSQTMYAYDAVGRVVAATTRDGTGVVRWDQSYIYDAVGNLTGVRVKAPGPAFDMHYAFDALNQLVEESGPGLLRQYVYDALGNRIRVKQGLMAWDSIYDAAGQLLNSTATEYVYDSLGRRIKETDVRGATTYTYSRDDRLTQVQLPWGEEWHYTYDPYGRRTGAGGPRTAVQFAYDGQQVIAEMDAAGHWQTTYAYGPGGLALRWRAGMSDARAGTTYHGDGLGNVALLTDAEGAPRDAYNLDPFGRPQGSYGSDASAYRFTGQYGVRWDDATGLYLMGQRYYDPATAQFLTRDPLPGITGYPLSLNPYAYAYNNPLTMVDPQGLQAGPKGPPQAACPTSGPKLSLSDFDVFAAIDAYGKAHRRAADARLDMVYSIEGKYHDTESTFGSIREWSQMKKYLIERIEEELEAPDVNGLTTAMEWIKAGTDPTLCFDEDQFTCRSTIEMRTEDLRTPMLRDEFEYLKNSPRMQYPHESIKPYLPLAGVRG